MIDLLVLPLLLLWACALGPRAPLPVRRHLQAGDRATCEACGTLLQITLETYIFAGQRLLCCGCAGAAERKGCNRE